MRGRFMFDYGHYHWKSLPHHPAPGQRQYIINLLFGNPHRVQTDNLDLILFGNITDKS